MSYNIEADARARERAGLLRVVRVTYTDHAWSNNGPVGVVVALPAVGEEYVTQSYRLRELAPFPGERDGEPSRITPPALPPGQTVE